jgi:hypothetical protein
LSPGIDYRVNSDFAEEIEDSRVEPDGSQPDQNSRTAI